MSSAQYLIDSATRHQVFLQRYGGGQSKEAIAVLDNLLKGINKRLDGMPTSFQKARLNAAKKDIAVLSKVAFNEISQNITLGAQNLALSESAFSAELFNKSTNTNFVLPSSEMLLTSVMTAKMDVGANSAVTIKKALSDFSASKTKQITQIINDGVLLGETTPQIAKNIGGVINTLQKRQIDTLARTITNSVAAEARNEVYKANDDIMDGYRWVSTLDNRTTLICGGRDGERYPDDNNFSPIPPAHWGCRSTTIPVILPQYDLGSKIEGDRPAISADGKESVSGRTTYGGWLKGQPKSFVDKALGKERSALFRNGKLTIDKFTDPTGSVYTLSELENLNPIAFGE